MRVLLCLCCVFVQFLATSTAPADDPQKAQIIASFGRHLTEDISKYATEGDAGFSAIIERNKLNEVDWDALSKDDRKGMEFLQKVILDLLDIRDRNEHAQAIIKKYNIKLNAPEKKK